MFTHIMVGANDLEKSQKFYDAIMTALGIGPGKPDGKGRVFYSSPAGNFAITKPINGQAACHANGGTIGFKATSPEMVNAWHAAGVANDGRTCEDPPGVRQARSKLYMAYLRDPDGNKLCASYRYPS